MFVYGLIAAGSVEERMLALQRKKSKIADTLLGNGQAAGPVELASLTPQEKKILSLIAEGLTNRQIGERMFLAEKTVKNYVSSILSKLEVARRAEAAAYLARHTTTPGTQG